MKYQIFFATAILLVVSNIAFSQPTCSYSQTRSGTNFENANYSAGDYNFKNVGNVATENNVSADLNGLVSIGTSQSHYIIVTGFGFNIPITASICGIQARVKKRATGIGVLAWIVDENVKIVKGSVIQSTNLKSAAAWDGTMSYHIYGGNGNFWGTSWIHSDINSAGFGIAFSTEIVGVLGLLPNAHVDHIELTVYYFNDVLPISILNFNADKESSNVVNIKWNTEANEQTFVNKLQRSVDGKNWVTIYQKKSTSFAENHSYKDSGLPNSEKVYYRVEIIKPDGNKIYSPISIVHLSQKTKLTAFPNPAHNYVQLSSIDANSTVRCYDANGRHIVIPKLQVANGTAQIDVSALLQGLYVLQVNEESVKFIKN